jgi:hypothetical protein
MPANRMSRFGIFIGTWNTTGEVLATDAGPAGTLAATDTYAWLPGGHFILHTADARFDGQPSRSSEVMGYDAAKKHHASRSYDDQGKAEDFVLTLTGKRWQIAGAAVRFDGRFDARGEKLTGLWEMKGKRGRWQPWIRLELVRA